MCNSWATDTTEATAGNSKIASDGVTIVSLSNVMPVKLCTFLAILCSVNLPIGRGLPSSCNTLSKISNSTLPAVPRIVVSELEISG